MRITLIVNPPKEKEVYLKIVIHQEKIQRINKL